MKAGYSILTDKNIKEYIKNGEIIIEPFDDRNLKTNSYDVTLGEFYYEEHLSKKIYTYGFSNTKYENVYNMYDPDDVKKVWGDVEKAVPYKYLRDKLVLKNIKDDDKIILLFPGRTILAHTNEFIGGVRSVTSMMKTRSSLGRNFIECCKCAGLGDCGYFNRWTMEITNNSHHLIPLVVGRRIAQIIFFETDGPSENTYDKNGKYQKSDNLEKLKENWKPSDMLPKMYLDYEVLEN